MDLAVDFDNPGIFRFKNGIFQQIQTLAPPTGSIANDSQVIWADLDNNG